MALPLSGSTCPSAGGFPFLGLYVHVPFCQKKCDYCAFYSVSPDSGAVSRFLARIKLDLENISAADRGRIRTIFVGGGNPTVLGARALDTLLTGIREVIDETVLLEWSVESNPETLDEEILRVLRSVPRLRLSLGLQRLVDDELRLLGRRGTLRNGLAAIDRALQATSRVGIDLILGVPGCGDLSVQLGKLVQSLPIEHVSAYFLSLESGTPLADRVARGEVCDPAGIGPDELFSVREVLSANGFAQYEISNFARMVVADPLRSCLIPSVRGAGKPGHEKKVSNTDCISRADARTSGIGGRCLHNMNYWLGGEYLGLGPAAVGTFGPHRIHQPASLEDWLNGTPPEIETLTDEIRRSESIMLRLRLLEDGLDLDEFETRWGSSPGLREAVARERSAGNLEQRGARVRLTRSGLVFANQVILRLAF